MKKIIAVLTASMLAMGLSASAVLAAESAESPVVKVAAMKGPTGMGIAYLNQQADEGSTEYNYEIIYAGSPDEITGELISGNIDIAALPVNLASVLYNKTEGQILTAAVNTLGVLYVVEAGDTVKGLADLAGKKVVASGMGSTPEYIFNYLLTEAGVADQVEVEYVSEHDEAVTGMVNGTADIILVPEPKVTAVLGQVEGARIAVDITEEWNNVYAAKAGDSEAAVPQLVQGVIVVQKAFAEEHPEILASFLADYAASVDFTNNNMQEASQIIENYGIVPKAAVALKALPNCNIVCITGDEMAAAVTEMLTVLHTANPASIGGTLNGEEMFVK